MPNAKSQSQEQKRKFGPSAERLPYVECTLNGRGGGLSVACAFQNITQYPTWIIDGRRFTGVMEPAALARHSGYEEPDGGSAASTTATPDG